MRRYLQTVGSRRGYATCGLPRPSHLLMRVGWRPPRGPPTHGDLPPGRPCGPPRSAGAMSTAKVLSGVLALDVRLVIHAEGTHHDPQSIVARRILLDRVLTQAARLELLAFGGLDLT